MDQKTKKRLTIVGGVVVVAGLILVLASALRSEGPATAGSEQRPAAAQDTSGPVDVATVQHRPGASPAGTASSRLAPGTKTAEAALEESSSVIGQKKKRNKKKGRRSRDQAGEQDEGDEDKAQQNGKLPPPSLFEGDH